MSLAADLDAVTAVEAYTRLVALLDDVEASEAVAVLDLDSATDAVSALSLQLLASAKLTFPPDRLRIGQSASTALAAIQHSKGN
ncbi:hypothetical protein SAMN04488020_10177 [Palleronia marisminoris]|uniref:STAS domain-containing protein n=1 Tax=Palleronia marisminoris TaxID=315423 RepID=A0A1Y5R7R4_9RHOB|nr:hypothetical protein [Palleronia marisminoris]SFG07257.1 hypothetical protein SAMN04488020_10177 [Palleronia marisminoris]SLN11123.1 hypothetical protein PAM7066_00079 [Palleronia marisminoris]